MFSCLMLVTLFITRLIMIILSRHTLSFIITVLLICFSCNAKWWTIHSSISSSPLISRSDSPDSYHSPKWYSMPILCCRVVSCSHFTVNFAQKVMRQWLCKIIFFNKLQARKYVHITSLCLYSYDLLKNSYSIDWILNWSNLYFMEHFAS